MKPVALPDGCGPALATWLQHVADVRTQPGMPGPCATMLKDGRLTLLLDPAWTTWAPAVQRELLAHECGHFLFDHFARCEDRDPMRWNLVADASLHHVGVDDILVVRPVAQGVTFADLGVPPCPPEVAYGLLPQTGGGGCGTMSASQHDGSGESILTQLQVITAVLAADPALRDRVARIGGMGAGSGRAVPELPPPPVWVRQVLAYLAAYTTRRDRERSWRREHRGLPDSLPGRSKQTGIGCRIFVDASGSIGEPELGVFLSAVCRTPELAGSDVIVFDSTASDPIPADQPAAVCAAVRARGGGTAIRATAAQRLPSVPAVWLTDAESGDGWPNPHRGAPEVWCVVGAATVPHGHRVQVG